MSQVANESPRQRQVILLPGAKGTPRLKGDWGPRGIPGVALHPLCTSTSSPPFKPPVHSSSSAGLKDNCLWQFIFQPSHKAPGPSTCSRNCPHPAPGRAGGAVREARPSTEALSEPHCGSLSRSLFQPKHHHPLGGGPPLPARKTKVKPRSKAFSKARSQEEASPLRQCVPQ